MKKLLTTTYFATIVAVGLVGLLFVATLLPIPGNIKVKVVKSGSMEPAVHVGSIVVIKPAASYGVGDVITFGKDTKTQIPTTHRIVRVEGEGTSQRFVTKGDANDAEDNTSTPLSEVHGKMLFTVPYLGYLLAFARTKLGFFILVGLPALAVFLEEGRSIVAELRRSRRRKAVQAREEVEEEAAPESREFPRRKVMGALGVLAGVGVVSAAGFFGGTLSYYSNSATSHGNTMRAGEFMVNPPNLPQSFSVLVSEPLVVVEELPQDTQDIPPVDTPPLDIEVSSEVVVNE